MLPTEPAVIEVVGEFSDDALDAIAKFLIADYERTQNANATAAPGADGFQVGVNQEFDL